MNPSCDWSILSIWFTWPAGMPAEAICLKLFEKDSPRSGIAAASHESAKPASSSSDAPAEPNGVSPPWKSKVAWSESTSAPNITGCSKKEP